MSVFRLSGDNALVELQQRMVGPRRGPSTGDRKHLPSAVVEGERSAAKRNDKPVPEVVLALCREYGIVAPVAEYAFHAKRRWRADYCWVEARILLEIDGGIWIKGRHVNPQGFLDDCEKLNNATLLGFRVLRYPPEKLSDAIRAVRLLLLATEGT